MIDSPVGRVAVGLVVVFSVLLGGVMLAMSAVSWARCQVVRPPVRVSAAPSWCRRPCDSGGPRG